MRRPSVDYSKLLNNINNPSWCTDTAGIDEAKGLIGQGSYGPWWYGSDISGHNSLVYFSDHFIYATREALSTDCLDSFFEEELPIFFDYVKFVDCEGAPGACTENETPLQVLEALDKWIVDEIMCAGHRVQGCEQEHVWAVCPTPIEGN